MAPFSDVPKQYSVQEIIDWLSQFPKDAIVMVSGEANIEVLAKEDAQLKDLGGIITYIE